MRAHAVVRARVQCLEANLQAPIATFSSPFDLPRCLSDGQVLCHFLVKMGGRVKKIYKIADRRSPGVSKTNVSLEFLRARKNIETFVAQAQAMQVAPGAVDYGSVGNDVLNGRPSRDLTSIVRSLAPK